MHRSLPFSFVRPDAAGPQIHMVNSPMRCSAPFSLCHPGQHVTRQCRRNGVSAGAMATAIVKRPKGQGRITEGGRDRLARQNLAWDVWVQRRHCCLAIGQFATSVSKEETASNACNCTLSSMRWNEVLRLNGRVRQRRY